MDMVHVVAPVMVMLAVPITPAIMIVPMPHRDFLDGRCG